jgi:GGDEF domain-containing protein
LHGIGACDSRTVGVELLKVADIALFRAKADGRNMHP